MSDPAEVPMVHYWRGQQIEKMTREELIAALIEAGKWNQTLCEGASADREMFARVMRGARPR